MDKYTLLIILNLPFVLFGILKAIMMFREGAVKRFGLLLRLTFWGIVLTGLIFAEGLYNYLFANNLTDTTPLSLADVVLVTGIMLALSLCIRLYAKVDTLEKRLTDLHQETSIRLSNK